MMTPVLLLCGFSVFSGKLFNPWVDSADYELEYRVDVGSLLTPARPPLPTGNGPVRVWIPIPLNNGHQKILSRKIESDWPYSITQDDYGNHYVYLSISRGDHPSTSPAKGRDKAEVVLRFVIQRSPSSGTVRSDVKPGTPLDPLRYLHALSRIPLDGVIGKLAARQIVGKTTDLQKNRAFYDFVLRTLHYSKKGEGWGHGDAIWACTQKYGNCTDFHSLLIGLARNAGIAARFVIGFPIPADRTEGMVAGYHCWAEMYDRDKGWVPVDASEAWKSKRYDDYFGKLPSDRVAFTVGRDLLLNPPPQAGPLNFAVYPYAEVAGKPVNSVPWTLHFRRMAGK